MGPAGRQSVGSRNPISCIRFQRARELLESLRDHVYLGLLPGADYRGFAFFEVEVFSLRAAVI
jgi:hypothetical protein